MIPTLGACYFICNKYKYPGKLAIVGNKYIVDCNEICNAEFRKLPGAKIGTSGTWSVPINRRNTACICYLQGLNPYSGQTVQYTASRFPLFQHQQEIEKFVLSYNRGLIIASPGLGKTLAIMSALERLNLAKVLYISSKNALQSTIYDIGKWGIRLPGLELRTYDNLISDKYKFGYYDCIVFDEAQKIKNPTSQRSKRSREIADYASRVYAMSGTPSPNSPVDWWNLCEVTVPGYLKEHNIRDFENRLAMVTVNRAAAGSHNYRKIVGWKSNPHLCSVCGQLEKHVIHIQSNGHIFKPSIDEVDRLNRSLRKIGTFHTKEKCLDLPVKIYEKKIVTPSVKTIAQAQMIRATSSRAIDCLTLLRELSDGFIYRDKRVAKIHEECLGKGCSLCSSGEVFYTEREVVEGDMSKMEVVRDELENLANSTRRCIIYAGFTASVDLLCREVEALGWKVIRIDGRGWKSEFGGPQESIAKFQETIETSTGNENKVRDLVSDLVCIVAHPGSAGAGLTLTASDTIIYYSNSFKGEDRMQSEDRIHRPSCIGARIVDIIHLPTDQLVLDSIQKKVELQNLVIEEIVL